MSNRSIESPYRACLPCFLLTLLAIPASPLAAQTCSVPGSHASIQEAIDDLTCVSIQLSAQSYPESFDISRSLTLAGPPAGEAIVDGLLRALGAGITVNLLDFTVRNGCTEALLSSDGAALSGSGLQVVSDAALPCPYILFRDGFESGDTTIWSNSTPLRQGDSP